MSDFLMRGDAPLTDSEWEKVDSIVVEVAKKRLVCRRVLPIFGPLGAGVETVPVDSFEGYGISPDEPIRQGNRRFIVLQELKKDFYLTWREIEAARNNVLPLALGPAAAASSAVAMAEDTLILRGDAKAGLDGLMTVKGSTKAKMGDWSQTAAFSDIAAGIGKLQANGFPGPYALIVSPMGYAQLQKPYAQTGALEISLIRELVSDGVFQSPVLKDGEAVLIADGAQNVDLAIGVDLSVAALGADGLDHQFRVLETVALRIKRPDSICVFSR